MKKTVLAILLIVGIASCNSRSFEKRIENADLIASSAHFRKSVLSSNTFHLLTYSKIDAKQRDKVNIYIEGDGLAWKGRYQVSSNPTPVNPLALKLAASDTASNVVYIGRPCQYIDLKYETRCNSSFWTDARFAQEVVDSINQVISELVQQYHFKEINLFGYSGGGALAVLVAAQRSDVKLIGTVAANLNHKEFTKIHKVTPLKNSLDAIDVADKVKNIEQFHFIGGKDRAVPSEVILSYVKRVNAAGGNAKFRVITDATHTDARWVEVWRSNLANYSK